MRRAPGSPILSMGARWLAPVIQVYALYVVAHGHYSPGGGFQGGAMFAASVILVRLGLGSELGALQFPRRWGTPLSSAGTLIYALVGLAALAGGGFYLDYARIPVPLLEGPALRSMGILAVEIGVAIAVAATLVSLYDDLTEPDDHA